MAAPTKPKRARRGNTRRTNQQFKKSLMDHVHPTVWSICALIFVLGQTLQNLGFNVSAPANRLASAYARGYELEVEQRIRTGQNGTTFEPIGTEDVAALRQAIQTLANIEQRLQHLESMAHPPANAQH